MDKYYLYRHIRLDKNQPFYIGIGSKIKYFDCYVNEFRRAFSKWRTNRIWKGITSRTNYEVEILIESDNLDFIKEKEKEFIKLYGKICNNSGILANFTDGGEGNIGMIWTEQMRQKNRISNLGKKRTDETKRRVKQARKSQDMSFCNVKIEQYSLDGKYIKDFSSIIDAVKETQQKSDANITAVCKGKRKSAGGYIWKYTSK